MTTNVFITRVQLSNYKSIRECSVDLDSLAFLIGQNGAGKSNFLDALRFVTDALTNTLEHALRERGGINEVRRRSAGHPTHFGIRLDWKLPGDSQGHFAFQVGSKKPGGFVVRREDCHVYGPGLKEHWYRVENGVVKDKSFEVGPAPAADRLYLVAASGFVMFRPLYDALTRMGFYNLNPEQIRDLQPPDSGEVLAREGGNLASVLRTLGREDGPGSVGRIVEFLSKVVPGIVGVKPVAVGKKETLQFRQMVGATKEPWRFLAENMSDGTLRALGILTALFQSPGGGGRRVPFIGIEEPEAALHPGAAGVLRDALRSAARRTQVMVTSHSPDLLDDESVSADSVLAVVSENGETRIGPLDEASKSAIRDRLYTAGELLRQSAPMPETPVGIQPDLFAEIRP